MRLIPEEPLKCVTYDFWSLGTIGCGSSAGCGPRNTPRNRRAARVRLNSDSRADHRHVSSYSILPVGLIDIQPHQSETVITG